MGSMASNPVASKRQRRRPKPGPRYSLRRHSRSAPTCHRKSSNQSFSGRPKRAQQDDCRNQQYSIVALTNSAAGIVERYAYSAYGEPVFATGAGVVLADSAKENRYAYTGREWDEGLYLYHFRARMYDAESGRFLARDPISYIGGLGLYNSTHRLSSMDPSGFMAVEGPPYPGATKVGDCWEISMDVFITNVFPLPQTNPREVPMPHRILSGGCVGIVYCAVGSCNDLEGANVPLYPELFPNTTCWPTNKGEVAIPDAVLKHECNEGEEKVVFGKQGVSPNQGKTWPQPAVPGGPFPPPYPQIIPGTPNPTLPPVVGIDPDDNPLLRRVYNYIWYIQPFYVYTNHHGRNPADPTKIYLCHTPPKADIYPDMM